MPLNSGRELTIIEPLAWKAEGDARMDAKVAEVSFVNSKASKVLWDTADLQSWVRVFEMQE
jgi:hypothetical protein